MTASPASSPYGAITNQGAATNIVWHHSTVSRGARAHQRGHRSAILSVSYTHLTLPTKA